MRTVYATGGYSDSLAVDVVGAPEGASFRLALAPEGQTTPPAAADGSWRAVTDTDPATATVELATLVDTTSDLGHFWAWLQVTAGQVVLPVPVMDPEDPTRRLLVRVV